MSENEDEDEAELARLQSGIGSLTQRINRLVGSTGVPPPPTSRYPYHVASPLPGTALANAQARGRRVAPLTGVYNMPHNEGETHAQTIAAARALAATAQRPGSGMAARAVRQGLAPATWASPRGGSKRSKRRGKRNQTKRK